MYRILIGLLAGLLFLLVPALARAEGIVLLGPDIEEYPIVSVVVRATDGKGYTLHDLEQEFTIQENVGGQIRNDIIPEVISLPGGQPIAFSLILETRNETTREDLNAARDFMRRFVQTMPYSLPGDLFEDADLIELWVPGLQGSVVVPFTASGFQPVALENAINQILPYQGDSNSLGSLLEQIVTTPAAGSAPHVIILAGRFANIDPSTDAAVLASAAIQNNVVVYAAPIRSDEQSVDFLRRLAVATGGKIYEPDQANAEHVREESFNRYKGQYLLRYTSRFTPSAANHSMEVRVDTPAGNVRQDIQFTPMTPLVIPESTSRVRGILAILILVILFGFVLMGIAADGMGLRIRQRERGV
jgi:hypothetical protein